jgi:hypothetical protein
MTTLSWLHSVIDKPDDSRPPPLSDPVTTDGTRPYAQTGLEGQGSVGAIDGLPLGLEVCESPLQSSEQSV